MNILYVTPYVPSRIRTRPYHLIRALLDLGHRVTLVTAAGTSEEEERQADALRAWGVEVDRFPVPRLRSLANCVAALPSREPFQAVFSYHPAMARRVRQLIREDAFHVVHIEHLRAARLVAAVDGGTPTVYDSVDCISLLFEQAVSRSASFRSRLMTLLDLGRTRRYEAQLLTRYDQVVITSQRDQDALETLADRYLPPDAARAPITIVTNGVDTAYFRPPEKGEQRAERTVIFTGKMSYHANEAGALYFARQVLPHIWAHDPRVRFQIVGKDPTEAIQRLAADERIEVTGTVADLRPYLVRATVAVCPVPYAVGVQFKVLEAMAAGTPVVCSPATFSGLDAQQDQDLLVADAPDTFAARVLEVMSDRGLAARLAAAGRRYVEQHHSWEACARRLASVYERATEE
ncbi:MAG: glycosyltransferase [Anaerolineae bacterium]|jgi:sugar transferase (PEP-CTERM/EpsH1 system associated)